MDKFKINSCCGCDDGGEADMRSIEESFDQRLRSIYHYVIRTVVQMPINLAIIFKNNTQ